MKRALVCGAGGFIGMHLVKKLRGLGYWVRGVDIKRHEWSPGGADEFVQLDLRGRSQLPGSPHGGRRDVRRGVPARGGHGRDGVHPLRRNRDHAQQRPDQHLHDGPGRPARRAALLLLVLGVRLPRHAARRAGDDGGRSRAGPSRQRVRLGEALLRAHRRGVRAALRDAGAHRALPELLRARRDLDRRPREGAGGDVPEDRRDRRRGHHRRVGRRLGGAAPTPTSATWWTGSTR